MCAAGIFILVLAGLGLLAFVAMLGPFGLILLLTPSISVFLPLAPPMLG